MRCLRQLSHRVETTFQQDCRHRLERIGDPRLTHLDKFARDGGHVDEINSDLRRQEARQARVVAGDDVNIAAWRKTPLAESMQRSQKA